MSGFKKFGYLVVKRVVRMSPLPMLAREKLLFVLKVGYWPNFRQPRSFTEKLHVRKLYETDRRLVALSDKVVVRKFVEDRIGRKYLIPLLYVGDDLDPEQLDELGDDVVVKKNNDSGSVFVIRQASRSMSEKICKEIKRIKDYGRLSNEWWYREIVPKIIVERRLSEPGEYSPVDYKFFVFETGQEKFFFVETIRRKKNGRIESGFFDSEMKPLQMSGRDITFLGCERFSGSFPASDSFQEMKKLALKLSEGFNFVRVDLYSISGSVFFGEMTFCPSEGRSGLQPRSFDFELGKRWDKPVLLGGSCDAVNYEGAVCYN